MKEEIAATVFFMARLVKRYGRLDADGRERFAAALTSVLFETYRNHWEPTVPTKGQAYRCLRMNRVQLRDPVLERACVRSGVQYPSLGLPRELTLWVDPGEVSCRYGEHSAPFCVSLLSRSDGEFSRRIQTAVERASLDPPSDASSEEEGEEEEEEEAAVAAEEEDSIVSGDAASVSSSCSTSSSSALSVLGLCAPLAPLSRPEHKTIPTVSNPNSVYQFSEFVTGTPQTWGTYPKMKAFPVDGFPPHFPTPAAPPPPPPPGRQFRGEKGFKSHRPSFSFRRPRVDKYHWVSKSRS